MSARSPFRSHLLQQWTNSRRSPIVVQQWLNQETIHEEEEWPSSAPSRLSLSPNRRQHSRRSFHNSSRQQDSLGLSSVDTSPSSPSTALAASSWVASLKAEEKRERYSGGLSAGAPIDFKDRQKVQNTLFDVVTPCNLATNKHGRTLSNHSMKNNIFNSVGETTNSSTFTATNRKTDPKKDLQKSELSMAIDRAVKLSRTTHLYQDHLAKANEGQPFTFRKLLCLSRKGRQLIDICFEFALQTTGDDFFAREERKTWSQVPAFLVAIVHDNQANALKKDDENDPYRVLGYSPPNTEGQLEDYASACAASQTAIHSLRRDGYNTEWVTSSVIKTPAFRTLVKAKSTDRIAALIKVYYRPTVEILSGRRMK